MNNLRVPKEWEIAQISDISTKGQQIKPNASESFIYVDIGSIDRDSKKISSPQLLKGEDAPSRARKVINSGDVLVSLTRPNLNSVALVTDEYNGQIASTGFEVIKPVIVDSRYIFALTRFKDFIDTISGATQGALYPAAKSADVQAYSFPFPPLAEQKVIAEKLDTLLAQVETTKARLENTLETLKQFRQSVLAAAVSGKLTEDWREKYTNVMVDSVQIVQQHKAYFVNQKKKYKEPLEFKSNELTPIIPNSWLWYRAEQLCDLITKGTTPKKENMSSSGDVPYIKVYNLTFDGSLDFSIDPTFVPSSVHKNELKRSKVFPGDVLMNIVGPPLGKVSIVPDSYDEWNINQAISIFRPVCGVSNQYLSLCLRDEYLLDLTKSKAKATAGQFNLTLEICRDYSIPVPPLEEQNEIVRRVNKLLSGADLTEQQVNQALERVNYLTQSILAKAFRGELTEQWRKDNPDLISGDNSAEALLKKIKAERVAAKPKRKSKK